MQNKHWQTLAGRSPFVLWNVAGLLIMAFTAGSIMLSIFFVYQYLYFTLDQANSIVVLRSAPDIDQIETDTYQKTQLLLSYKQPTSTLAIPERNFFNFSSSTITQHAAPPPFQNNP